MVLDVLEYTLFVILALLLALTAILYPGMGSVFLVKYFKTKTKEYLYLASALFLIFGGFIVLFILVPSNFFQYILLLISFCILSILLADSFFRKYSKEKKKKYFLLGLGYVLIPIVKLIGVGLAYIYANYWQFPDMHPPNGCYIAPPKHEIPDIEMPTSDRPSGSSSRRSFNAPSSELILYKESLTNKFADSLPKDVIEKITKK